MPRLNEHHSSLAVVFSQIAAVSNRAAGDPEALPDPVRKVMQQILGLRLSGDGPSSGQTLQKAVQNSGVFREALMKTGSGHPSGQLGAAPQTAGASGPPILAADLKSLLMHLKSMLRTAGVEPSAHKPLTQPPLPSLSALPRPQRSVGSENGGAEGGAPRLAARLLGEIDSALARIRLTQLANLGLTGEDSKAPGSRPMDVVVELPITAGQDTAILQMQVGRDRDGTARETEDGAAWRLRFALDLSSTGPLEAAVSLRGGQTFVSLWIERADTFNALAESRQTLEAAFADAGLDLQELRLLRGRPHQGETRSGTRVDRRS